MRSGGFPPLQRGFLRTVRATALPSQMPDYDRLTAFQINRLHSDFLPQDFRVCRFARPVCGCAAELRRALPRRSLMDSKKDDELVRLSELHPDDAPAGIDRRAFMMRSALVGAMGVISGCAPSPEKTAAAPPPTAPPVPAPAHDVARPRCRQEGQRPGDDDHRRVLQGRPRPVELAHHRTDAHHLRFLPARDEAARRSTGAGHRR